MAMDSDVNHAALQTVLNAPDEELKSAQDNQRREEDHRLYDTAVFADDQGKHTEEHENGHTMVSHKFQSLDLGGAEEVQTSEEGEDKGGGGHGGGGDDRKAGSNQGLHPSTPLSMNKVQGSKAIVKRDMVEDTVAARERDISAAFAGLPRVKSHWTHNYLKILLVGEDGLGKTTFVRNLFAAYASDVDFPVADASAPGAFDLFQSHPERLCTELVVKDEDALVWWHYLIQDTPGYGDFDGPHDAETQRNAIVDYVNSSLQKHLDGELDPKRRLALHTIPDVRVDVCLYFLPPHRMRQTDARFVKELRSIGGLPVLPIIAKADTMTAEELAVFRESVCHSMLQKASTGWKFSKEALEGAGAGKESYDIPPFAVVSAATVDRSVGRFWPVRKYPWGTCEPLLSAHSDLPVLRRLLFETGFWELKAQTERRYLAFRKDEWKERHSLVPKPLKPVARLILGIAATVAATFIIVNGVPMVKDETVRRETVRRVKNKVGGAVENAWDAVHDVQDKAEDAAQVARSAAEATIATSKRKVESAASKFETPMVKAAKEAADREAQRRRAWWKFW